MNRTRTFVKQLLAIGWALWLFLLPANALAHHGDYHDTDYLKAGTGQIEVLRVIELACNGTILDFGELLPNVVGTGTVTVTPTGEVNSDGLPYQHGGSPGACVISNVSTGRTFQISLPESVLVSDEFGHQMAVDTITWRCTDAGEDCTGEAGHFFVYCGSDVYEVPIALGGTLHVTASQAPGQYVGAIPVTVSYA